MDNRSFVICLLVVIAVVAALYFVSGHTNTDHYVCGPDLITKTLPTSPEVEYIEGEPDMHVVNHLGQEVIPHGDIAMSPGYGVGEGLVGFGRFGNTMMA
jgi:hypothetical protein